MINEYLTKLQTELTTENALEHSYRPALKNLFERLDENITAVNEPVRSAHGSPDFVFFKKTNKNIILGYVETKDIYVNLNDIEKTSQLKRYLGYSNLILTNYIEFRFFRNGEKYQTISIAQKEGASLIHQEENFLLLERELKAFLEGKPERIRSGKRLSEIMGGKASRIRENVNKYLHTKEDRNKELERIYEVMKELLVHDLSVEKFSDMYAQTLVYGLFVARYHDKSPDTFSRQEARDLVPSSNPFLQHFFDHIIGPNFDRRLGYIVDELCEVFAVADIRDIIQRHFNLFGEVADKDPIIHFYEDFLKEYDPALRKSMGAYYTPVPVVKFMIRAVDDILKKEFKLVQGIADTTKIQRDAVLQGKKYKESLHKVQILDPAVGTATFLNEIIKYIYEGFKGQEGVWQSYVESELLSRLFGFELMMAPYTIAHLKLAMTLKETGIEKFDKRIGVYLTNTLEAGIKHKDDLFSFGLTEAISEESKAAGIIKHDKPIMVVIGNPPYSGESNNKDLFKNELEVYKREPTGGKLQERNSKWINDDYVKFMRFAETMIERIGEGIVAMITPHGYIDNPTFRGVRMHLMNSFDLIYVLDLHGNSNKKEKSLDGKEDQNVFDIKTGVAILLAVKKGRKKNSLAKVNTANVYGKRALKFEYLKQSSISSVKWTEITTVAPNYDWVVRDESLRKEYSSGFSLKDMFVFKNTGMVTKRDKLCIQSSIAEVWNVVQDFISLPEMVLRQKYHIPNDVRDWKYEWAKKDLIESGPSMSKIIPVSYRPFDTRYIYYTGKARGFVGWPVEKITRNYLQGENVGLLTTKANRGGGFSHVFVTKNTSEVIFLSGITASNAINFPLYLYDNDGIRKSNFNNNIVDKFKEILLDVSSQDIFDYIYAILHSPYYRNKFDEFLKIDYPRIPYPTDVSRFNELVKLGRQLRNLHLLNSIENENLSATFPEPGSGTVETLCYEDEKVQINEKQYFGNITNTVWSFNIGSYQPAQKWLKDRKGRILSYEDITHYRKMIYVLEQTIEIMKQIDNHIVL